MRGERGGATLNERLDVASARRLCVCLEIRCDRAYVARCRVRWGSCWEAGWYRENSGGVESRRGGAERQSKHKRRETSGVCGLVRVKSVDGKNKALAPSPSRFASIGSILSLDSIVQTAARS